MQTDIQPTMNDDAVMDFIANGYVILENVISESFNQDLGWSRIGDIRSPNSCSNCEIFSFIF